MGFCEFFFSNVQLADALLFNLTMETSCRKYLIDNLKSRFAECKIKEKNY